MDKFRRLGEAYIGDNKSHIRFVKKLVNVKLFFHLFMNRSEDDYNNIRNQFKNIEKKQEYKFSFAIVTRGISNTQAKAIYVRNNELKSSSIEEYHNQVYKRMFTEVHRIFTDYLIELYDEITSKNNNIQKRNKLSYKGNRYAAYDEIKLSITPNRRIDDFTPDTFKVLLSEFENIRNVIEHFDGIIDEEFLKNCQTTRYQIGEEVVITPENTGEAIALVETIVENLNERASQRFLKKHNENK